MVEVDEQSKRPEIAPAPQASNRRIFALHRLRELEERGIVAPTIGWSYTAVDGTNSEDLIWLPNTLITGTES